MPTLYRISLSHCPGFFLALLLAGCTSYNSSVGDSGKNPPGPAISSQDQERIEACLDMAKAETSVRVYQFIQGEGVAFEQTHQIRVDTLREGAGYRFREIYNSFSSEDEESVEFYLSEFTLRANDLNGHHVSEDFRVIVKPDTAYLQFDENGSFELDTVQEFPVESHAYKVFRLLGHEHNHGGGFSDEHEEFNDENPPSFYQYWTPTWGTVFIRFANGSTFQLYQTDNPADSVLFQPLLTSVKEWDGKG